MDFLSESGIRTIVSRQEYHESALDTYRRNFLRLSLCDAATIVVMNALGVEAIASYDERSFKEVAKEVRGIGYHESLSKEEQARVKKKIQKKIAT